jgi:hypothetical protein
MDQPCHICTNDKLSNIGQCWQGIFSKAWVVNMTIVITNSHVLNLSRGYQANEQCANSTVDVLMINYPALVNVGKGLSTRLGW